MSVEKRPGGRARRVVRGLAWGAVVASFPVWLAAFVVAPFLPLPAAQRAVVAGVLIGAGEALFWGAGLVLGAEVMARLRPPKVTTGASFRGRRVLVIGATGGLGAAVARAVRREGGEVVLVARDRGQLGALAAELETTAIFGADLTVPASLLALAAAVGPVDHVVCAAGVDVRKPLAAHSDEEIDREIAVDLVGPMRVARAFLPGLRAGGTIALFGGFADGRLVFPYYAADVAARAGLAAFCQSVNQELSLEGRAERLCYLCPAPADTAAERPFAALWASLGSPLVPASEVANFVLASLLARRTLAVMGWSTRQLARIHGLMPVLAGLLVTRVAGPKLRARFGGAQ